MFNRSTRADTLTISGIEDVETPEEQTVDAEQTVGADDSLSTRFNAKFRNDVDLSRD